MRKYVPLYAFMLVVALHTSSEGQVQKDLAKERVSEVKPVAVGQPKLTKTQSSQKSDNVNSSIQDKAGNLWFGTTSEGLYKYDGKLFTQFTVANGLISNKISCILEDKEGNIWIGTEAGVCLYDGKTFTRISIPLRKNIPPNPYGNTHHVFSIMQDKCGKLWLATLDGVYVYDGETFTPFILKESGGGFLSSNPNVERILEDKAGNLWFGGRNNEGVYRYDGKSITNLKVAGSEWAWPQVQDKHGNIWFSNWTGAYRYDGHSFMKLEGLSRGPVSPITRIMEDRKGHLWFGGGATQSGLWRFDGTSFRRFMVVDGLPNNDVWSILEDRRGQLWIGTRNTGLFRYDGKMFTTLSTTDKVMGTDLLR
jgi:ligand-binding sensor domain-containing protein